jgi:hypothetical protein
MKNSYIINDKNVDYYYTYFGKIVIFAGDQLLCS